MVPENPQSKENHEKNLLSGKVALITGSSRDIGAGIAIELAKEGVKIIGNYREKGRRADGVRKQIVDLGVETDFVQADITDSSDRGKLITALDKLGGNLDILILNASGPSREINVRAANALIDEFLPKMPGGATIILMQSIPGHFYPILSEKDKIPDFYEPIARAKYEGEQSLRERIDKFNQRGISFFVVCPPEVSDTANMHIFKRRDPAISQKLAEMPHTLDLSDSIPNTITVQEVGETIANLLKRENLPQGHIEFFQ
jgi:3-oxoacyl-[acyl-carrier protein] reductase